MFFKFGPSTFYTTFSLADLIARCTCDFISSDVSGGGGGGGCATGTGVQDEAQAHYQKSETHSFQITGRGEEAQFISQLKAEIEKQIADCGANVTISVGPSKSGFALEYAEEGIRGRIEISGELTANYYSVNVNLIEASGSEKNQSAQLWKMRHDPEGQYYAVGFKPEDPRASTDEFFEIGRRAIKESNDAIGKKLVADYSHKDSLLSNLKDAEVFCWRKLPAEITLRISEAFGEDFSLPSEYDGFAAVYFLNEHALKLYREAGADFEIFKNISSDELPRIPGPSLRGPYLPKTPETKYLN